jgi:hypothetical protein
VRDVAASHDTFIYLFERIHFFLRRLKSYTGMPLTNESMELLGKIVSALESEGQLGRNAEQHGKEVLEEGSREAPWGRVTHAV